MLNELRKMIHEQNKTSNSRERKYFKKSQTKFGAKEYNCIEKFTTGVQQA